MDIRALLQAGTRSRRLISVCAALTSTIIGLSSRVHAEEATPPKTFNVRDFGAKGDGRTDDQAAIGQAIKAAQAWTDGAPSARAAVNFPAGVYNLTRQFGLYAINIVGAKNLTIEGEDCRDSAGTYCVKLIGAPMSLNARLRLPNYNSFFRITNSHAITIRNFYLDKQRPYFSQGIVTAVAPAARTMDLRVDDGYADFTDPAVGALLNTIVVFTDPQRRNWDHSQAACADPVNPTGRDCHNFHIVGRQPLGPGQWRIELDQNLPAEFAGRPYLMWRNLGWQPGFMIDHASDITLENIFYTGGGGPGVDIQASAGTNTIRNFVIDIPPHSNRLFAATSGFHGSRNHGRITLDHVHVAHTDDDAFHFAAASYYPALDQTEGGRKVRVNLCYDGDFRPGDRVAAWDWTTKSPLGEAAVVSAQVVSDSEPNRYRRTCDISLDRALPPLRSLRTYDDTKIGRESDTNDRLLDLSYDAFLTVKNSYLSSMRARCGIIQVSALIANNTCANTILAGFLIGPEFSWGEGYAVNNVRIIDNVFDNVSGTAIYVADIGDSNRLQNFRDLMKPDSSRINKQRDNRNIVIQGNSFTNLGTYSRGIMGMRGVAISVENASNVRILANRIDPKSGEQRDAPTGIVVSPTTTSNVVVQ